MVLGLEHLLPELSYIYKLRYNMHRRIGGYPPPSFIGTFKKFLELNRALIVFDKGSGTSHNGIGRINRLEVPVYIHYDKMVSRQKLNVNNWPRFWIVTPCLHIGLSETLPFFLL
jgi:hypothetical protein